MITDEHIDEKSRANETVVEKRFKRIGLIPKKIDRQGTRPRPDFLVSDSTGPMLVCEVKTVFSAGYLKDRNAHLSTADPALVNSGTFSKEVDFSRIDENLSDAVRKYRALIADLPNCAALPMLVVLFFDFFADYFNMYPRKMDSFPEVSGIAKVVNDYAIRKAAEKLSMEELKERIDTANMKGLPASSKDFILLENECARIRLPAHFVAMCRASDE